MFPFLASAVTAIFLIPNSVWAYDFSPNSSIQKAKKAQRWTLAQWMEQKGNIRWMDAWLNTSSSPSYSELYLSVIHSEFEREQLDPATGNTLSTFEEVRSVTGQLGGFVSIFGLHGEFESNTDEDRERWQAYAMLRLFGSTDQGTNLTGFFGAVDETYQILGTEDKVQQLQAGGYMTLYLLSAWALQLKYHSYMSEQTDLGYDREGHRYEATTWVEYGALRLFGSWFQEEMTSVGLGQEIVHQRQGITAGFRLYLDIKD